MKVVKAFKVTLSMTAFLIAFVLGTFAFIIALGVVVYWGDFRAMPVLIASSMWLAFLAVVYRRYLRDDWPR